MRTNLSSIARGLSAAILVAGCATTTAPTPAPARARTGAAPWIATPWIARDPVPAPRPSPEATPLPRIVLHGSATPDVSPTSEPVVTIVTFPDPASVESDDAPGPAPDEEPRASVASVASLAPPAVRATERPAGVPFLEDADIDAVRKKFPALGPESYDAAQVLVDLAQEHVSAHEPLGALGCLAWASALAPTWRATLDERARHAALGAVSRALVEGHAERAREVAATLPEASVERLYTEGELADTAGDRALAGRLFRAALDGVDVPELEQRSFALVRELARRRALGCGVGPTDAGIATRWHAFEVPHFVIVYDSHDPAFETHAAAIDGAWLESVGRLGLSRATAARAGRVTIHVYSDLADFHREAPFAWCSGFARDKGTGGPDAWTIAVPERSFDRNTIQHELAHVLAGQAWPRAKLPAWATEGIACHAESAAERGSRRRSAGLLVDTERFVHLDAFFARDGYPESATGVGPFYDEASVVVDALVDSTGSVAGAVDVIARVWNAPDGPGSALDLDGLEVALRPGLRRAAKEPEPGDDDADVSVTAARPSRLSGSTLRRAAAILALAALAGAGVLVRAGRRRRLARG